jgi:hypothetical protein
MPALAPVVCVACQLHDREHEDVEACVIVCRLQFNPFWKERAHCLANDLEVVGVDRVAFFECLSAFSQDVGR